MKQPKTFAELMENIRTVFPDADVQEDLDGQLVVYTGLREDTYGNVVEFEADKDPEASEGKS